MATLISIKLTGWNEGKHAWRIRYAKFIFRPTLYDSKILFRLGSIIELGKASIAAKFVAGYLISFIAIVERPPKSYREWKCSYAAQYLKKGKNTFTNTKNVL